MKSADRRGLVVILGCLSQVTNNKVNKIKPMNRLNYLLHKYFSSKSLNKIDLILAFLALVNLILIFREWILRYDSLIGLSDEGYLYSQLISSRSADPNISLFAILLSSPFEWFNFSIIKYRIFGLLIVIIVAIFTLISILKLAPTKYTRRISIYIAILSAISVMLIPSTFRFLLISPGYQWLIAVTSIVVFLILLNLNTSQFVTSKKAILFCFVLFLILQISLYTRLPYTFLIIVLTIISLYFMRKRIRMYFMIFLISSLLFFILTQDTLIDKWIDIISIGQLFDPKGYSIFNELIDLSVSVLLILITIILGNIILNHKSNSRFKKISKVGIVLVAIVVLIIWTLFSRDRLAPFVFFGTMLAGGFFPGIEVLRTHKLKFSYLLFLSLLPVTSQFGSNTPALANSNLVLIFIAFFVTISIMLSQQRVKNDQVIVSCLLLVIAAMQIANSQRSFETSLDHSHSVTLSGDNFSTSREIAENINVFQNNFESAVVPQDERIMDLSMFHPGGGLYLDRGVLPLGTASSAYKQTINLQLSWLIKEYPEHFDGKHGLILISLLPSAYSAVPSNCLVLKNWLKFQNDDNLLIDSKLLEFKYKVIATMKSTPDQVTLYPKNLHLISKCQS